MNGDGRGGTEEEITEQQKVTEEQITEQEGMHAMVVPTDVQAAFAVGAVFADVGASAIRAARRESPATLHALYTRYRFRAVAYPVVFVGPAATLFMLSWPAWESQYWTAAADSTAGRPGDALFFAVFLGLLFGGGWLGNRLGFTMILAGHRRRLRALYSAVLAVTVVVVFVQWPAPVRLGTYADFHADASALPYIWDDGTFFAALWVLTFYCTIPIVVGLLRARADSRRVVDEAPASPSS